MRLTALHPKWIDGGPGLTKDGQPGRDRHGVGVTFDCPCGACGQPCVLLFSNPLDGLGLDDPTAAKILYDRAGETFETLTVTASIDRPRPQGCGWHGTLTQGEVTGRVEP